MNNYSRLNDLELGLLLHSDDNDAYTEIFNRYNGLLYIHAYKKLQNTEEAKDVVQETFVMLWTKRNQLAIKTNMVGYLYTAVQHKVLDIFARKKTAEKYVASLQFFLNSERGTDYLVREKVLSEIIEAEIEELPFKMRQVFELSRKKQLSYKEISEELGISEETVKSHIKNALKVLRLRLRMHSLLAIPLFF